MKIVLRLAALLVMASAGIGLGAWLSGRGIPPSVIRNPDDRDMLQKSLAVPIADDRIYQFHRAAPRPATYYRFRMTDAEYTNAVPYGWQADTAAGDAGAAPLWWRPPALHPDWAYFSRYPPHRPSAYQLLARDRKSGLTYYMAFSE